MKSGDEIQPGRLYCIDSEGNILLLISSCTIVLSTGETDYHHRSIMQSSRVVDLVNWFY